MTRNAVTNARLPFTTPESATCLDAIKRTKLQGTRLYEANLQPNHWQPLSH